MSVPTPSPSDLVQYDPQTWVDVPAGTTPPSGALTMSDDNLNHIEAGLQRAHLVAIAAWALLQTLQSDVAALPEDITTLEHLVAGKASTSALDALAESTAATLATKASTTALSSAVAGLTTPMQATALAESAAAAAVSALIDGAPDAANTLRELKELLDANASGDAATAAALSSLITVVAGKATPADITTAVNGLAAVARSGSYTDLLNKPTIPAAPDLTPYLTRTDAASAYAQKPSGGTDGQALVKSGATTAWATVAGAASTVQAQQWSTSADATTRQMSPSTPTPFGPVIDLGYRAVTVDRGSVHQPVEGFGAALTGASAYNINRRMTQSQRTALLTELFSPSGLNLSMVLITMGSSDFDATLTTYDDVAGDTALTNFSIESDQADRISVLREIRKINPRVKVIACPWSPPAWMKTNPAVGLAPTNAAGNTFNATYWAAYAQYFVKFIQAYADYSIPIWAISPQNEPLAAAQGWPCMLMSAADQITFVGTYLGPALDAAGLNTRILGYKHNWDQVAYPSALLADTTAAPYFAGIAWHWYAGSPTLPQNTIARRYPNVPQYFLEACGTSSKPGTMAAYHRDIFIGSMRAHSRAVVMWNIALDENGGPTIRGDVLKGLVTIPSNGSGTVTRNVDYWALAQSAKFVAPGASRIGSTSYSDGVQSVAYANPDGSTVVVAFNSTASAATFQIVDARTNQGFPVTLPAGEVATWVWASVPVGTTSPNVTPPGAPSISAAAAPVAVNLTWTAPSPGGAPISGYQVYSGPSAGALTPRAFLPASATNYSDKAASSSAPTFYALVAVNAGGLGAVSNVASATATPPAAPAAPVLSGTAGSTRAQLSWTVPATNGAAITGYRVYRDTTSSVSASGTPVATIAAGTTSYLDTGLTNGTAYYYAVTAVNGVGQSVASNVVTVTPALGADPRTVARPTTTTQPSLWLRGDQLSGASGSSVTTWSDYTNGARDAVRVGSANVPTLLTGAINAQSAVRFVGGSQQKLVAPQPVSGENLTVLLVMRLPTLITNVVAGGATSDAKVNGSINTYTFQNAGIMYAQTVLASSPPAATSGTGLSANAFGIFAASWDTSANSRVIKSVVNGGTVGSTTPAAYTPVASTGFFLGGVGTEYGTVDIAEAIVFPAVLSDADRRAWQTYLSQVHNIAIGSN